MCDESGATVNHARWLENCSYMRLCTVCHVRSYSAAPKYTCNPGLGFGLACLYGTLALMIALQCIVVPAAHVAVAVMEVLEVGMTRTRYRPHCQPGSAEHC